MKAYKGAIIFDGDDTLWPIQSLYDQAEQQFCDLMEEQGFDWEDVKSLLREIDKANVEKLGFSRLRYSRSMKDVYEYLSMRYAQPVKPTILEKIEDITA